MPPGKGAFGNRDTGTGAGRCGRVQRVLDQPYEGQPHLFVAPHVGGQHRRVQIDPQGGPDLLRSGRVVAVECVQCHDERDSARLEVVDRRERVGQLVTVDEDHGTDGPAHQVVPQEPEPVLARGTEQIEHQDRIDGEPAEVRGHGGG